MTANLPTLQALLARVEGGEENRALDAEIALHLGEAFCRYRSLDAVWQFRWQDDCEWEPLPHFTTSLDAAVALVERVRPGDWLTMHDAPTLACALIAALIRAEIAETEERRWHDPS